MTELQRRFEQFILEQQLCQQSSHRILVGVSGGKDSVLLLHLLVRAGYSVGVAHCNFNLRGRESDLDEQLVRDYAEELDIPFYVNHFQTADYARDKGLSIQMAARELRYDWFESLCHEEGYDFVAVAHHATDNVETVLINQLRGTGIRGLVGMQVAAGRIIRPLLFLTADEVAKAVEEYSLVYRDDQSNFSTDYVRNKLRLEVGPRLREINPGLEETFARNMEAVREVRDFLDEQVEGLRQQYFSREGAVEILQLDSLLLHRSFRLLLYELLRPYGFSPAVAGDVADSLKKAGGSGSLSTVDEPGSSGSVKTPGTTRPGSSRSGQQFYSPTHQLLLDRRRALIRPLQDTLSGYTANKDHRFSIEVWDRTDFRQLAEPDLYKELATDPYKAYFDADSVQLPLRIRQWKEGDTFRPFGMGGKHKKLSDLFTGLKLSRWQKEEVPVVEDAAGNIIWVVPYRMSSDYNICDTTKNVMVISYFCQNG